MPFPGLFAIHGSCLHGPRGTRGIRVPSDFQFVQLGLSTASSTVRDARVSSHSSRLLPGLSNPLPRGIARIRASAKLVLIEFGLLHLGPGCQLPVYVETLLFLPLGVRQLPCRVAYAAVDSSAASSSRSLRNSLLPSTAASNIAFFALDVKSFKVFRLRPFVLFFAEIQAAAVPHSSVNDCHSFSRSALRVCAFSSASDSRRM